MVIFALGVGLPEFKHGVRDRRTVAIQDAADQAESFAFSAWAGERAIKIRRQSQVKEWTDGLWRSRNQNHI